MFLYQLNQTCKCCTRPHGRVRYNSHMPYAHTPNSSGQWHELQAHLQATAAMARAFAERFGAGECACNPCH